MLDDREKIEMLKKDFSYLRRPSMALHSRSTNKLAFIYSLQARVKHEA